MGTDQPDAMLARLAEYEAKSTPTGPLYDDWSPNYERDLIDGYGYTAHLIAADAFAELATDWSGAIVDFGCGTGLVGEELAKRGYTTIDGLDISTKMLEVAQAKAVYRQLRAGDLTARTSVDDGEYDAAICVGSFAPGHLGPSSLAEIARSVAPGGPIVIFMNGVHFVEDDYQRSIDAMVGHGLWTVESITTHNYMSKLERPGRLIVARR